PPRRFGTAWAPPWSRPTASVTSAISPRFAPRSTKPAWPLPGARGGRCRSRQPSPRPGAPPRSWLRPRPPMGRAGAAEPVRVDGCGPAPRGPRVARVSCQALQLRKGSAQIGSFLGSLTGIWVNPYISGRMGEQERWNVEGTDESKAWYLDLDDEEAATLDKVIEKIEEHGPQLGRPYADTIQHSWLPNLKELIADGARFRLRVLFVFDPRRTAILLLGSDKTGEWQRWYRWAIPEAERLYAAYLRELREE